MPSFIRILALTFAIALLAAACGDAQEAAPEAEEPADEGDVSEEQDVAAEAEEPPDPVEVTIAKSQDAVTDLHAYAPQTLGSFEEHGVEAEIIVFDSGSDARNAFIGGAADYVIIGVEHAQRMRDEGLDARAVLSFLDRYMYALMAPADSGLEQIEDLHGERIGITGFGASTDTVIRWDLSRNGMDPETDVEIIEVGGAFEQLAALQQGQVSAGMVPEPAATQGLVAGDLVAVTDYTEEPYAIQALIGRGELLDEDPDGVQRVVNAFIDGVEALREDQDVARAIYEEQFEAAFAELEMDEETEEALLEKVRDMHAARGELTEDAFNALVDARVAAGEADSPDELPSMDEVYDDRFVQRWIEENG